ncbi:MAG: hypothetical protein MZU97_02270 [Bacillus subtilis]|nr:hypothetical protein [Bacillus subtilis]
MAKTQVLARNDGNVHYNEDAEGEVRRLLIVSSDLETKVELKSKPILQVGDLVKVDQIISEGGEISNISGQITKVDDKSITCKRRKTLSYKRGTQLQVEGGSFAQRGDLLATLIFERQNRRYRSGSAES